MTLTRKLTLAIVTLGMVPVIVVQGYTRVLREKEQFERDARRYHDALGHGIGMVLARILQEQGEEAALSFLEDVNRRDDRIEIRWVWLDEESGRGALVRADRLEPAGHGQTVFWIDWGTGGEGRLYSYVPVPVQAGRRGAIELGETLSGQRRYLRNTVLRVAGFSVAMAVLATAVATVVGTWIVGRPTRRLVAKARRVGSGDLEGPLAMPQKDELGELAREVNAMCEHLKEARARVALEASARSSAVDQLRHADRLTSVGKLAAGIAHELGTPLAVVSGRARMISSQEVSGDEALTCARIVVEQSERMTHIIRQLLDYARPSRPRQASEDLGRVLASTVSLLQPLAEKERVRIRRLDGPAEPVVADVDPAQIQQVLVNLLVNGIHAMPRGGELRVGVRRAEPDPATARPRVAIDVEDEGEGIPEAMWGRVFEPFYTTKRPGEGTGLGLAVALGIVRDHGGDIGVGPGASGGARFTIYLPEGTREWPAAS